MTAVMVERPSDLARSTPSIQWKNPRLLRLVVARRRPSQFQEPRAQHRRQREADEHRHQDRKRHRPGRTG